MFNRWMVIVVLSLLAIPFTVAQSAPSSPDIWEHIKRLENAFGLIKMGIFDLNAMVNGLSAAFSAFQLQTNQEIDALNQTDQNLQGQISGISTHIDRGQLYEVENTDFNTNKVFCNTPGDIMIFAICPSGFLGSSSPGASVLYDNFNDLDYASNPQWQIRQGGWSINTFGPNSGKIMTTSVGTANIIETPASINSIPVTLETKVTASGMTEQLIIALSNNSASIWNGYLLRLLVNGSSTFLDFQRVDLGVSTQIALMSGLNLSPGIEYAMKAARDGSGYWRFYLNGSQIGPTTHDTVYANFTDAFLIGYNISGASSQFDDVNVSVPGQVVNNSPFINLNDANGSMGIQCQSNGFARVLCLRQN